MPNTIKEIRVTMPTGDYQVVTLDGMARHIDRLIHTDIGTTRRRVWYRGSIPGRAMHTILKLAGFTSTGDPIVLKD